MSDAQQRGRASDDRDAVAKSRRADAPRMAIRQAMATSETDRLGRDQQRRATAYARARGQL
ncbi:MAG: Stress-induced protein [Atopobium sp.]|jgi:hypothetical protein